MINNATHLTIIKSPLRSLSAGITHYGNETTAIGGIYRNTTLLKDFTIERTGENKFFGFGICQKLSFTLIDKDRIVTTNIGNFKVDINSLIITPTFALESATRDEVTNEVKFVAYDYLYKTNNLTFADLGLMPPYTYEDVVAAIASKISGTGSAPFTIGYQIEGDVFQTNFPDGANLDGSETLRSVLNAIAEATQTIYYINTADVLVFKKLDKDGEAVDTIDKSQYFELNSTGDKTLEAICHATELGDNVISGSGLTQYVRNNPFWEKVDKIWEVVDQATAAITGLTINQFTCSWRGNYLLEPGDKIDLITKDDETITSYILSDTITYEGGLKEVSNWMLPDNAEEAPANPTTLGEVLKQTVAKVDKVNQEITLVANKVDANSSSIAALEINTESISASVESIEKSVNEEMGSISQDIEELRKLVELQITDEDLSIKIQEELANGVTSVTTTTGFTFDEDGLTISKSDSDISTQITEDGMTIYKNGDELLVADNEGVKAEDLHATTYLLIGANSRFEDYENSDMEARTGCFWIGGE